MKSDTAQSIQSSSGVSYVVDSGQSAVWSSHGSAGISQALESLWRGNFVNQMSALWFQQLFRRLSQR